ncbi:MAG: hypothetical protein IJZ42_13225 [Lachnospiraceae bacterium]|nr:hypothetical protein [Lachnospiraceae bacterium]
MKTISQHLGQIILAVAAVALIIGVVLTFGSPVHNFMDGVMDKLYEVGNGPIWNVGGTTTNPDEGGSTPDDGKMILKAGTYRFNDELVDFPTTINTLYRGFYDSTIGYYYAIANYSGFVLNPTADGTATGFAYGLDVSSEIPNGVEPAYFDGTYLGGILYPNKWVSDDYKIATISEDSEVDDTFGTWFISNTNYNEVNSAEETYVIEAGTYRFNDVLSGLDSFTYVEGDSVYEYIVYLNFINDGNPYTDSEYDFIDIITDEAKSNYGVQYGRLLEGDEKSYLPVYTQSGGWSNAEYQPLTLPNDVEVDNTFGSWFAANTKRVIEVDELPTEDIDTEVLYSVEDVLYKYENDTWFTYVDGAWAEYVEADDSIVGTWVFSETISPLSTSIYDVQFTTQYLSSGVVSEFSQIKFVSYPSKTMYYVTSSGNPATAYYSTNTWAYEEMRTITILSEPTDSTFIAWLKANATKQ